MSLLKHFKRLFFIDYLICKRATGNVKDFAAKNRLSRSGMLKVLKEMKDLGFPLRYSRDGGYYYYEKEGGLVKCLFEEKEIIDTKKVKGILKKIKNYNNLCYSEKTIFEKCYER